MDGKGFDLAPGLSQGTKGKGRGQGPECARLCARCAFFAALVQQIGAFQPELAPALAQAALAQVPLPELQARVQQGGAGDPHFIDFLLSQLGAL